MIQNEIIHKVAIKRGKNDFNDDLSRITDKSRTALSLTYYIS